MAETAKVNHDHTYDILTSLMNIGSLSPKDNDALLEITSPQPSDASSDSGLALSPITFEGLDFADDTSLSTFDLDTLASSCSPMSDEKCFYNIDDITDIDLSFLDGLDEKTLGKFAESCDKTVPLDDTDASQLESFMEIVDDGIVADVGLKEMEPLSLVVQPFPKTMPTLQVVKTTAIVTPIVITGISPVLKVEAAKFEIKNKADQVGISEEERKLLEEEGHDLPTNVALTKDEEKLLKKVRRKIKNKVSAQESRRKKKEYIDGLEDRVKNCTDQNRVLQKKVDGLEDQNKSLLEQLKTLQELVSTSNRNKSKTSTCILVLFLAFAFVAFPFNGSGSSSLKSDGVADSYATVPVRSRTLLQYNEEAEAPSSSALNISHYLRAFSVVFSFAEDKEDLDTYSKPASISFENGRNTYEDGMTNEYSFSK